MPRPHHSSRCHRLSLALSIISTALLLPTPISSVSLGDFSPRASGLTDSCNDIYTSQIPGCTDADFTTGSCSATCINALVSVNTQVYADCEGAAQNDQMLIAAFLSGKGISSICPNVVVTTFSASGVTLASTPSSTLQTTTLTVSPLAPSQIITGGITTAQTTAIPSSILVDTLSPPHISSASSTSSPEATSTTTLLPMSLITSSVVVVDITSTTIGVVESTLATHEASSSRPLSVTTSKQLSGTSTIMTTSVISSVTTLLTTSFTTTPSAGASSSSSSSTVVSLASSSNCLHSGDPMQYCSSASSMTQSSMLFISSSVIAAVLFLSFSTWHT